jgi:hypothetical protein
MYFDPAQATSSEPGRSGETLWEFFERSGSARALAARKAITVLLGILQETERNGYIARLKSSDRREVQACGSELYMLALLTANGETCEVDPATPGGSVTDIRLDRGIHLEVHRLSTSDADRPLRSIGTASSGRPRLVFTVGQADGRAGWLPRSGVQRRRAGSRLCCQRLRASGDSRV